MSSGQEVADLVSPERHIHLAGNPTIGAMRNVGCEHARGEVIATFDDDDYSAPERLAFQVRMLLDSGKAVCGFRTMRFTDGSRWRLYTGGRDYAVGTSLVYRRDWWARHRFPELQVGEDTGFVAVARARSQIVVADAGDLQYATIHFGNTSPRDLTKNCWKEL